MRDASDDGVKVLEWAMVGTLAIASAICIRLWFIMEDIRLALTDPNAMAYIIADDKIHADSKKAEDMLNGAKAGFHDTEAALAVFSTCVGMIAIAMIVRLLRSRSQMRHEVASPLNKVGTPHDAPRKLTAPRR